MLIIGICIIILTVYLLVKRYEARMVLLASGFLMALLAGKPLIALDAFAKGMAEAGLIQTICSVMGFAYTMKATKCDQHLIKLVANVLMKLKPILIPGATLGTFAINIALPSAAGVSAAFGAIYIPLLIAAGVSPAIAGAAVLSGTYGSMLSPGLAHNPFIAKLAGVSVMDVIYTHAKADIAAVIIAAISITLVARVLKEDKNYAAVDASDATKNESVAIDQSKANVLYAIVPIVPIALLILGATGIVPALKVLGVPQVMVIGVIIGILITRTNPGEITKEFFDGMGSAYAHMIAMIIVSGVFVSGMKALGLVDAFIKVLIESTAIAKYAATYGPFLLAIVAGSGDGAAFAFNGAVTPHAVDMGMGVINMGGMAALGGALGRTMSPITAATLVCAGIAGVHPMELAKRNALGMFLAVTVAMFILL